MHFQPRMPICRRCGNLHDRMLEYTWASYCQRCDDEWIVEQFVAAPATQHMTAEELVHFIYERRPELFARGVMPGYLKDYLQTLSTEKRDYRK